MEFIPEDYRDLLENETRAYAYLATIMDDGSPQVTPVWFNTEGDFILINSVKGRVKDKNMRARPRVALTITDPKTPYRYLQIRGRVVEYIEQGAEAHIHALSQKYTGEPKFNIRPGDVRVIYKIAPRKVFKYLW